MPVLTARSVVQLDARKRAERGERWRRVAEAAAKQAKRVAVPRVADPVDAARRPADARGLRRRGRALGGVRRRPGIEAARCACAPRPRTRAIALVVGPEGGLSAEEVAVAARDRRRRRRRSGRRSCAPRRRPSSRLRSRCPRSAGWADRADVSAHARARRVSERPAGRASHLGCKVNRVESEAIAAELLGRGVRIVDEDEAAVVDRQHLHGHRRGRRQGPQGRAAGARGGGRADRRRDRLPCGARSPTALAGAGRARGGRGRQERGRARVVGRAARHPASEPRARRQASRAGAAFRTRALLKIEDGCDAFCTYCIVPYARGVPRSVPLRDVVSQAESLVAAGVREIVLTGINIGRYADAETGADLADVLRDVAATGIARVRLSSIEPLDLTPRLLGVMASEPAFCAHLHVPLQSGE